MDYGLKKTFKRSRDSAHGFAARAASDANPCATQRNGPGAAPCVARVAPTVSAELPPTRVCGFLAPRSQSAARGATPNIGSRATPNNQNRTPPSASLGAAPIMEWDLATKVFGRK